MPKAVKGTLTFSCKSSPTNHSPGVLVECDPSIKAIILKIDHEKHDYIVEDLDDQTLVIKESQLQRLKVRLGEVCIILRGTLLHQRYAEWDRRNLQTHNRCQRTVVQNSVSWLFRSEDCAQA